MARKPQDDLETRIEADQIELWAERLNVTPEELRSAVQKGGETMKEVVDELRRRGKEPKLERDE